MRSGAPNGAPLFFAYRSRPLSGRLLYAKKETPEGVSFYM